MSKKHEHDHHQGHGHRHGHGHGHGHRHGHGHGHGHGHAVTGDWQVAGAVVCNLVLTLVQLVGGVIAGSVALIADAVHNLSDALALIIAFVARRVARRPATPSMTFGFGRAEMVAALVNYTVLIVICLWLGFAAVERMVDPPPVAGGIVVVLALAGLVINGVTAALTFRLAKDSLNIRAAFLHNLSDAGTSLAVAVSGLLVWWFGWRLADPLITLAISLWILWHCFSDIGPVIRILMLGAPDGVANDALEAGLLAEPGVLGVHHLHLWQIDENRASVEGHLVLAAGATGAEVLARVKERLARDFGLSHSTFELEVEGSACAAPGCG